MTKSKETLSEAAFNAIDGAKSELVEVALDIHAHPELNYQEQYAASLLSGTLERYGLGGERSGRR